MRLTTLSPGRRDRDTVRVRAAMRALGIRERQGSAAKPQHGWASLTRSEQGVVESPLEHAGQACPAAAG
jgi:hypothetical protein